MGDEPDTKRGAVDPWTWLDRQRVLNLATCGPQGPWSASVYFARDGMRLIFLSSSRSRHVRDLDADPRCAGTVSGDAGGWSDIRGIQLEGRAQRLHGDAATAARAIYRDRFEALIDSADAAVRAALERVDWFELVPDRMLFIDNSRGFGSRRDLLAPGPGAT